MQNKKSFFYYHCRLQRPRFLEMLHNGDFNYSQQPYSFTLPIPYPSSTQVLPKYMPWIDLGYTLDKTWVRLGDDMGKTWVPLPMISLASFHII